MASHGNLQAEPAKIEQIITDFFAKSLHIILESRSPFVSSRNYSGEQTVSSPSSSSSSSSVRPRDKWFNLALRDCPVASENLELWRQNTLEPLVVDVILVQRAANLELGQSPEKVGAMSKVGLLRNISSKERFQNFWNTGEEDFPLESGRLTVIERWIVQYENRKASARDLGRLWPHSGQASHKEMKKTGSTSCASKGRGSHRREKETGSGSSRNSSHSSDGSAALKMYKKSMILLRSLYVFVRLLPAYKIFRHLNSSSKIYSFSLNYKVMSFIQPLSRAVEADMQQFNFVPVDTPCGRLGLSVLYHPTLSEVNFETSTPLSPQLIPDYVGSPTTTPLKRFSSGLLTPSEKKGVHAVSLLSAGERSPSSVPFARRHSWGSDLHKATPYLNSPPFYPHSFSPSPSPTYSEPRASPSNLGGHRLPPRGQLHVDHSSPISSPRHLLDTPHSSDTSLAHKKATSFDESWPSPPFSPSLSPSPPTHLPGNHLSKALLRSESAPVSIPFARIGSGPGLPLSNFYDRGNILPPYSSPKCIWPGNSSPADKFITHIAQASISLGSPPESKLPMKPDLKKSGKFPTGMTCLQTYSGQKVLTHGNEDGGSLSGMKISSSSSPQFSVSRSSSRLSFPDEYDDSDFTCPFAVDDDDVADLRNRSESFDRKEPTIEALESGTTFPARKSQDAAVGALVRMLQTAPPLRQNSSDSIQLFQVSKEESWGERVIENLETGPAALQNTISGPVVTDSGFLSSKTTADALEELRVFREMKDLLLGQSGSQSLDVAPAAKAVGRGSAEF